MNATLARRGLPTLLAAAFVLLALGATSAPPPAHAAEEFNPWAHRLAPAETDRVIVKLKASDRATALAATTGAAAGDAVSTQRVTALGARTGVAFAKSRSMWGDVYVARVDGVISVGGLDAALAKLRADPEVEYAEPDARMRAHLATNDPRAAAQWYLQPVSASSSGQTLAAINATAAWDVTQGSASVIVAVLDTGVRPDHPDLSAKFLTGRDFVSGESASSFKNANDGDDWDADASDPGDWISATDLTDPVFSGCGGGPNEDQPTDSSWHGTRVSGIIGASTNNAVGIAGIGFNTRILPVRVLGKCGGSSSDIIAGMRWAAGLPVNGVPTNTTPAKILNLSLGGTGACTTAYQTAIDEIVAARVLVIASAGNEGLALDRPSNCRGVLSVGAVRHAGTKVGFSNLGSNLSISAPGGNCVNATGACLFSIDTTSNAGTTTPGAHIYTDQNNPNVGTSFSAPIASGASALLYAANAGLTPAQAIARLKASAHPFPVVTTLPQCRVPTSGTDTQTIECSCTTRTCGAGMVDAGTLLTAANAPQAAFTVGTVVAGSPVALDAVTSSAGTGSTIASYAWSVRPGASGTPTFTAPAASSTQVSTSTTGSLAVQLTVTDSLGRTSTAVQNLLSAVPNLAGLTRSAAEAALLGADLALGVVSTQPSATVATGSVVSQSPAAASSAASGAVVAIVISSGPQQITVPDVVNQTQTNAQSTITTAGLTVGTVTQQSSATVASGSVISQTPAAGSTATAGSAVALVVSTGPAATGSSGGGGGGGGGGTFDAATLVVGALLALGAAWGRRRRELARRAVQDRRP